jgi:ABC-2 type transport system permease protein
MSGFLSHVSYELHAGIRNRALLLMNYLFPLGLYLILGGLMARLNPPFIETMIPAMIVIAILSGALLGLPSPLVAAREAGIFRSYRVNGVPALSILSVPTLTTVAHTAVVAVIIALTAPTLFGAPVTHSWGDLILVFGVTAFAVAGLGTLIGVISSTPSAAILWQQLVFLPSMMIGGLMVPSEMLPEPFGRIGRLLPATHAMNAFRGLAQGRATTVQPFASLAVLLAGGVVAFVLAAWLFRWDSSPAGRGRHPALALLVLVPYAVALILAG